MYVNVLLLDLLVGGLATWRITHLLLYENGPWRVFRRIRVALGVVYYEDSNDVATHKYEITTCVWCLSMWVGAAVGVGMRLKPRLLLPYALSACAVIMHKLLGTVK